MDQNKNINIIFGNKTYLIDITPNLIYKDFIFNIFKKVTKIELEETASGKEYLFNKFSENFYCTWITKCITNDNWETMKDVFQPDDSIFINSRCKGGFLTAAIVILAIFAILSPILKPVRAIFEAFIGFFKIFFEIIKMMAKLFEILFLVFDPPTLIDDILFAVTFGINEVMNKMSSAISNGMSEPEDDTSEKGIFATRQEEGNTTCMSPTYSTLFLLIICPPLAIMYKLGFWKGFVSSIICGVLCVKLFYFPGLLFAILHVLC